MHKKYSLLIFVIYILGLLCSPNVYSQPRGEVLEEVAQELEEAQENSKKLLEDVGSLQDQFGKQKQKTAITKEQMDKSVDILLAHYASMSEKEVSDEIIQNMDSKTLKNILIKFPKLNLFLARILKDKEAVKKIFALSSKTEELKKAGLWFLGTIFLGFILNKLLFRINQSLFSKLRSVFIRFVVLWSARITIIVYYYGENLAPAFKIFKKTFLS